MSEKVIRHRGGGRDENDELIPPADDLITAMLVAPGVGSQFAARGRDGENIACTVYFAIGTDVVNSDELTVRGERFAVIVNDWHVSTSATGRPTGRGGLEVLCTRGQG